MAFRDSTDAWLQIRRGYGQKSVQAVFDDTLAGRTKPADGHVISLWDDEAAAAGR